VKAAPRADWIAALAAECERTSQGKAAKRLGVSGAVVNQALRGNYCGRLDRLEQRVRGELMASTLVCPELGTISTKQCQDEQATPYHTASRMRVAVYRACRAGCANFKGEASPQGGPR
jgi:hypothetical protein